MGTERRFLSSELFRMFQLVKLWNLTLKVCILGWSVAIVISPLSVPFLLGSNPTVIVVFPCGESNSSDNENEMPSSGELMDSRVIGSEVRFSIVISLVIEESIEALINIYSGLTCTILIIFAENLTSTSG